ncbi:MAG TPA: hypothetical protein VGH23_01615 [Rhizomicrobium sp.]|jgi:hypothetical protein
MPPKKRVVPRPRYNEVDTVAPISLDPPKSKIQAWRADYDPEKWTDAKTARRALGNVNSVTLWKYRKQGRLEYRVITRKNFLYAWESIFAIIEGRR